MSFLQTFAWQHVTFVIILPPSCKHQDSCTPTIFDSFYRLQDDLFIGGTHRIYLTGVCSLLQQCSAASAMLCASL